MSLKIKLLIKIFFNRLINDWNALPAVVVNVNSVNNFKSLLDNHLFDSRDLLLYNG